MPKTTSRSNALAETRKFVETGAHVKVETMVTLKLDSLTPQMIGKLKKAVLEGSVTTVTGKASRMYEFLQRHYQLPNHAIKHYRAGADTQRMYGTMRLPKVDDINERVEELSARISIITGCSNPATIQRYKGEKMLRIDAEMYNAYWNNEIPKLVKQAYMDLFIGEFEANMQAALDALKNREDIVTKLEV